jgi:hypothetical protein
MDRLMMVSEGSDSPDRLDRHGGETGMGLLRGAAVLFIHENYLGFHPCAFDRGPTRATTRNDLDFGTLAPINLKALDHLPILNIILAHSGEVFPGSATTEPFSGRRFSSGAAAGGG